jgi:hypothetical protein
VQVEYDVAWRDPRPSPVLRLRVSGDAPRWSILSRRERDATLESSLAGRIDLVGFEPGDTGLDRLLWIGRGVEVVTLPRRPGDRAAIGRDCVAVGLVGTSGAMTPQVVGGRWVPAPQTVGRADRQARLPEPALAAAGIGLYMRVRWCRSGIPTKGTCAPGCYPARRSGNSTADWPPP